MTSALGLRTPPFAHGKLFQFLLLATLFAAVALSVNAFGPKTAFGVLGFLTFAGLGFLDFPKFLLSAIVIRSALDGLQETAIPLGPLQLNPAGAFGLLLIFLSALHLSRRKTEWAFAPVRGFLLFLLFLLPSVGAAFAHFGAGGAVAAKEFIRLCSLLALLISLLSCFRTPEETKKLFRAALASLIIPLSAGFYQAAAGAGNTVSTEGQNRIFGTLFHPNAFSLYLSVFTAVALAWHKSSPSFYKKLLLGGLLAGMFLTYSMGALVSLGIVFTVHFWSERKLRILLLALPIFMLPALTFFSDNWQLRLRQISQMRLGEEIKAQEISNSFSWRVLHWYVLFQLAREHPITGWGLLTTEKVTPWKTEEGQGFAAHNDAVRLFLETGLVGIFGYALFLFYAGRWILQRPRARGKKGGGGGLTVALKGIFLNLLVLSLGAEEPLIHTAFVYYFFAFLALEQNGFRFAALNGAPNPVDKNSGGIKNDG